jgi:hypothetical protein
MSTLSIFLPGIRFCAESVGSLWLRMGMWSWNFKRRYCEEETDSEMMEGGGEETVLHDASSRARRTARNNSHTTWILTPTPILLHMYTNLETEHR